MNGNPDNPAIRYLASTVGGSSAEKFVTQYADYLLGTISCESLPVNLDTMVKHLNIKVHKVPLAGQRALSTSNLNILVEQDDRETVHRYSIAHEMIEFLFHALNEIRPNLDQELLNDLLNRKESLCELGAANLLMPMKLFRNLVQRMGFSINTGKYLASFSRVSLTASLRRMLDTRIRKAVLIYFRFGNSSGEFIPSTVGQTNLFGPPQLMDPPKKLRVLRTFTSSYGEAGFVPNEKSIENNTSIFRCYETGRSISGHDDIDLVSVKGNFFVESIPVSFNGERRVLSLLYLE